MMRGLSLAMREGGKLGSRNSLHYGALLARGNRNKVRFIPPS